MNRVDYLRGDTAKWLARLNHTYASEDFFRKLTVAASDDHSLHVAKIDDSTVFVTGFHLEEKCSFRLGRRRAVIESRIVSLLRNPVLKGSRERTVPRGSAMQGHIVEETSSIRRNGGYDGNAIGKNIAVIQREQE